MKIDEEVTPVPITILGLSGRTLSCLSRAGIDTIDELMEAYASDRLKTIRNLGRKSLDEINEAIAAAVFNKEDD